MIQLYKWLTRILIVLIAALLLVPISLAQANSSAIHKESATKQQQLGLNSFDENLHIVRKHIDNSNYSEAISSLKNLEKIYKQDPKEKIELFLLFAETYKLNNENEKCVNYLLKAKELAYKQKDHEKIIICGIQFIEFYRKLTNYNQAAKTFYEYSYLAKKYKIKNPSIWNGLYNRFAAVNNEINHKDISIKYSKLAIEEAEKMNDLKAKAISYNELGFTYKNKKDTTNSLLYYRKAEVIFKDLKLFRDLVHVKMNILYEHAHFGLITQPMIIKQAEEILAIIETQKVDYPKSKPLELIRNYYEATRQYAAGYYASNRYFFELSLEKEKTSSAQITQIVEQFQNNKLKEENNVIRLKAKHKEQTLSNTKTQLVLVISLLLVITISFFVLNFYYRKTKVQNKQLDEQNQQKSLLIQEIHHRVKNNLQFVHSMLELQRNTLSEDDKKGLNDLARRINAMSLIHEQLYMSNDQEGINIHSYLISLMNHTIAIFKNNQSIDVKIEVPNIDIPVDKALPIGIICAELFNNSVKHAFVNHENPSFEIYLGEYENQFQLKIKDNGKPKTEQATKDIKSGLGTRLVDIFSRQLKGNYTMNKENGYEYILRFNF